MAISRRTLIVSVPLGSVALLAGTGAALYQSMDAPLPLGGALKPAAAPLAAPPPAGERGGVLLKGADFPGAQARLQPSDHLDQACLNGDKLAVCISDQALGRHRSLMLRLVEIRPWDVGVTRSFDLADAASATLHIHNAPDPFGAAAAGAAGNWVGRQGRLDVTMLMPGELEIVFAPVEGGDIQAQAVAGWQAAAPASSVLVSHATPLADRKLRVRLVRELENST